MAGAYFKPIIGRKYDTTRVLILSESAYSWIEDGRVVEPPPLHPKESLICWGIDHFGARGYFTAMGKALCGTKTPSRNELEQAWDEYAYTIFIQGSVGLGWKSRPTEKQWQEAKLTFISLIEEIRPRPLKVIVTGKTMWNHMPDRTGPHIRDDIQAYKQSDGTLLWCLAVPHPSSRKKGLGFQWELVGENIRKFRSTEFPLRES